MGFINAKQLASWLLRKGEFAFYPVKITAELLVAFGFEEKVTKDGRLGVGTVHYQKDDNWIYLFDSGFEFEYTSLGYRLNLGSGKYKYVHQLQNLYFALTGEELTLVE